jgi:predicted lipoprotein with Yx(FWY)xxD motif
MRRAFALTVLFAAILAGTAGASGRAVVGVHATPYGSVLVAGNGKTLYSFTKGSACYGACATVWKPLLAKGSPAVGVGLDRALLGTVKRKDGTLQVTYNGHPLYLYALDGKAGQAKGQGAATYGGRWFVLTPGGVKVDLVKPIVPGSSVLKPLMPTTNG